MSRILDDFEIMKPPIRSLFQLAVFKIAVPLFNDFGFETLESAYREIQLGNSHRFNESKPENCMASRAIKELLFIPAHLRHSVFTAIKGMRHAIYVWRSYHCYYITLKGVECTFYWRYNGLIDDTKTAQQLVLNSKINIKQRFDLACEFCFVENVLSLWAEMDASDKKEYLETTKHKVAIFWVKWMSKGCVVSWIQALVDFFRVFVKPSALVPRRYSFFPLLSPEERWRFLPSFFFASNEDLQLCLYTFTSEEKEWLMRNGCFKFIFLHLQWPLQSVLLEKFEALSHYIDDERSFPIILHLIWIYYKNHPKNVEDLDYCYLMVDLWNAVPQYFRESVERRSDKKKFIDECLNKYRSKRKVLSLETSEKRLMEKHDRF